MALYKETERKLKMISLLKIAGFTLEALPYARKVFQQGLEVLKTLDHAVNSKALRSREELEDKKSSEKLVDLITFWMEELPRVLAEHKLAIALP